MTERSPAGELLTRLAAHSLDDDYAAVAERTKQAPPAPARRRQVLLAFAAALALLALLLTLSVVQTRGASDQVAADREALIDRIEVEQADVAQIQDEVVALGEQLDELRVRAGRVDDQEQAVSEVLDRLGAVTGTVPVTGPGLRITVDDAPSGAAEGTIRDTDLQLLVNGLWQAGAEAIAVGGQRITTRSAIRTAGLAITVNYRSLSPPYVVLAIGNPDTLPASLLDTTAGQTFTDLRAVFGIVFRIETPASLMLPGRPLDVDRAQPTQATLP